MAGRSGASGAPVFEDQLVLFRYFLRELGIPKLKALNALDDSYYATANDDGNTRYCDYLRTKCPGKRVGEDKLREYDENICRHTKQIGRERGGSFHWFYFQYLALLFTEMYLDRYFGDREAFCRSLNDFLHTLPACAGFRDFRPEGMNRLAFMCATGSGKTLLMHANILQYRHYFEKARQADGRLSLNRTIVLAPNAGLAQQHKDELDRSSVPAVIFDKSGAADRQKDDVLILNVYKLREEEKRTTVSVDSFEQNNLLLVDEGHRGLSGEVWYDQRSRLYRDGFAFEYSATFKQALNASEKAQDEKSLMEEYGKSILMDYSYKYFFRDGYGKNYRILNLQSAIDDELRQLYLTGCLLSFYQQLKVFHTYRDEIQAFRVEQPLLVYVGNRVTAKPSKEELTDVEEVLVFFDRFVRSEGGVSLRRLEALLSGTTGLVDERGRELFDGSFYGLRSVFGAALRAEDVFQDMLRTVFHADTATGAPRLQMEVLDQVPGEIALRIGEDGTCFGVVSVGDTRALKRSCEDAGIRTRTQKFVADSLFGAINTADSKLNILIGSRKFTEGWNSWRVSAMGLINFAKGEGSQAIQLFGRGVRLKGYKGCLKRSDRLETLDTEVQAPPCLALLETLMVFGVRAKYMEVFREYLAREGLPHDWELRLPTASRFDAAAEAKLHVIRVKSGIDFLRQGPRLVLDAPAGGFSDYLYRSKTKIDCRSRIQTLSSAGDGDGAELPPETHTLPGPALVCLNYDRIFEALERYKAEKGYHSLTLVRERLIDILRAPDWYELVIPESQLRLDSVSRLETLTDYAILALKSYMDKRFRYEKAGWEADHLEYALLTADDANFVPAYTISYAGEREQDPVAEDLAALVENVRGELEANGGLKAYAFANPGPTPRGAPQFFDFRQHLYAPLLHLPTNDPNLRVTPVPLNRDEKGFVDKLKAWMDGAPAALAGKTLWLLRNKSKTGMGFFDAENFYPDFILWIDDAAANIQRIAFIDPKGLRNIGKNHPKIMFHRKIKELQARLAPTARAGKTIILSSFILSGTPLRDLERLWDEPDFKGFCADRNVFMLEDADCIPSMIEKILSDPE